MILLRALHKDISRYNQLDSQACLGLAEIKMRWRGKGEKNVGFEYTDILVLIL